MRELVGDCATQACRDYFRMGVALAEGVVCRRKVLISARRVSVGLRSEHQVESSDGIGPSVMSAQDGIECPSTK